MFTTKKGSENWEWGSKEEHDANIMKEREPKLNKRRSLYRLDSDIQPFKSEQQKTATNDEATETRQKIISRRRTRKLQKTSATENQRQVARDTIVDHVQDEPDSDVQMAGNDSRQGQDQDIQALLHELTTRNQQVEQLQHENEQQKQTIQELTTANLQSSMNASTELQNRNQNLEADKVHLQKTLQASEDRNAELKEENLGLRAAYNAIPNTVRGRGSVPNHEAIIEAANPIHAAQDVDNAQPLKCQGFQHILEHTKTYICEDPEHPSGRNSVSCSACTTIAISIADAKGQEVAQKGGIVATICQRCYWGNGEHLAEECKCLTANRCVLCVTDLLDKMAENAQAMEDMDLEKCSHCGKQNIAEEEKVRVCVTCQGRREQ
ncbi:hypothetical protein AC578_4662 [Pseudocercospora eumusae]|uniref:Uncharacterized protein n=1 Tax=Pseudocercospora eumusae TaxID=321146 RepID=A0A139H7D8_9PEZI|nr:hypothetical protein AC578_4662 [Pseudocercospora eumusae]